MSISLTYKSKFLKKAEDEWYRNPEWIPIPNISTDEQVLYSVIRVDNDTSGGTILNEYGIRVIGTGTISVDWGDGIIETLTTNVAKYHQYSYSACTNLTSMGYKQCLLKITSTGNITQINNGFTNARSYKIPKVLDIVANLPNITTLDNFVYSNNNGVAANRCEYVERVWIKNYIPSASMNYMFSTCYKLKSIILHIGDATVLTSAFRDCVSLSNLDNVTIDSISTTSLSATFQGSSKLQYSPSWLKLCTPTILADTFNGCYSITDVEFGDISSVGDCGELFYNCYTLRTLKYSGNFTPTIIYRMFNGCYKLCCVNGSPVITIDCSDLTSTSNQMQTFNNCNEITGVVLTGRTSILDSTLTSTFQNCYNCEYINISFDFNCIGKSANNIFTNCRKLKTIDINCSGVINVSTMFGTNTMFELESIRIRNLLPAATGADVVANFQYTSMSRDALIQLFNDLPDRTSLTAGTINITGTLGTPNLIQADRDIALNKNYTITG